MYGLVNDAIKGLLISNYGESTWEAVREASRVELKDFISHECYDDSVTYELATAASQVLNVPLSDVLFAFGEYWVLVTAKEKYSVMLSTGGVSLKDFLVNLPGFHSRVMLLFPKLTPPEFKVENIADRSLDLHYISEREGLKDMVLGLLNGLGKLFETPTKVKLTECREWGHTHEVFHVSW